MELRAPLTPALSPLAGRGCPTGRVRGVGVAGAVLLLAGCMVGPDYVRPTAPVPAAYKEMEGWKRAEPRDAIERGRWWEMFVDPELKLVLVQTALDSSEDAVFELAELWRSLPAQLP